MSPADPVKDEAARIVAAYKDLFSDPGKLGAAKTVIANLSKVCHMQESGWHEDVGRMQHLTGRREVFIHITNMINLTPDAIERMVVAEAKLTEPQNSSYNPLQRNT